MTPCSKPMPVAIVAVTEGPDGEELLSDLKPPEDGPSINIGEDNPNKPAIVKPTIGGAKEVKTSELSCENRRWYDSIYNGGMTTNITMTENVGTKMLQRKKMSTFKDTDTKIHIAAQGMKVKRTMDDFAMNKLQGMKVKRTMDDFAMNKLQGMKPNKTMNYYMQKAPQWAINLSDRFMKKKLPMPPPMLPAEYDNSM